MPCAGCPQNACREACGKRLLDTSDGRRAYAKTRRNELGGRQLCINGATHGPATRGIRCDWCGEVHRIGVLNAIGNAHRSKTAPQPPPGYVPRIRRTS